MDLVNKFREAHAGGLDGKALESAFVAAVHEAAATAEEAAGRATVAARELTQSIVVQCGCPHLTEGSSDVPANKPRNAAFCWVASETRVGKAGSAAVAAAARARSACGPLVTPTGVLHPEEGLAAFEELEAALALIDELIPVAEAAAAAARVSLGAP